MIIEMRQCPPELKIYIHEWYQRPFAHCTIVHWVLSRAEIYRILQGTDKNREKHLKVCGNITVHCTVYRVARIRQSGEKELI